MRISEQSVPLTVDSFSRWSEYSMDKARDGFKKMFMELSSPTQMALIHFMGDD